MAVKMHNAVSEIAIDTRTHSVEDSRYRRVQPGRFQERSMENTQRRAIGVLVVFAAVLTLMAVWNLPETAGTERAV